MKRILCASFALAAGAVLAKTDLPELHVDATRPGAAMPNTSSVLTLWNGVRERDGRPFPWPEADRPDYPVAGFVRYCELMACTGGNATRDLFRNPDDRTVLDDYDFEPLVRSCRSILRLGMKPYLKLGNVPRKFTADYDGGEFSMNIRPPTDDRVHYRYMKACAAALKAAFGRDEVRAWRFCSALVVTNGLSAVIRLKLPPTWAGRPVKAWMLALDNRNNWFEDWRCDRARLGIAAGDFHWSPDDFVVLGCVSLKSDAHRKLFAEKLQPGYAAKAATVRPSERTMQVGFDATLSVPVDFTGNGAVHLVLDSADGIVVSYCQTRRE